MTHFFSKLFLAAPESFFSFDAASHAALASFSHFCRNEVLAAPASFFSFAAALHPATAFRLDGDRFELRFADGALAVSLTRSLGER